MPPLPGHSDPPRAAETRVLVLGSGSEIPLPAGAVLSIGHGDGVDLDLGFGPPTTARLVALGEGEVRVEAWRRGVAVGDRDVEERLHADLTRGPVTVFVDDEALLELSLGEPTGAAPAPRLALAPAEKPALEFDPASEPARPTAREALLAALAGRAPWKPLPRRDDTPRSILISLSVHAALIILLGLLLSNLTWTTPRPPTTLRIVMARAPLDADRPQATPGADEPDEETGTAQTPESIAVRTPNTDTNGVAAPRPPGLAAEDWEPQDSIGVGGGRSGTYYAGRTGARERLLAEGGGDGETEGALRRALAWLAAHQDEDGTWGAQSFEAHCGGAPCGAAGREEHRDATTALALLAYLGAGHDHRTGPWRDTVKSALRALSRRQRADGSFGRGDKRAYDGALALFALSEAYGMTSAPVLRGPAQRAVDYWVKRQSDSGGWRYFPGDGEADTSVTGWVAMGLLAAERAGLNVPRLALDGCRRWMSSSISEDGRVGYLSRGHGTTALLGVGYFVSVMLGRDAADAPMQAVADRLLDTRPRWSENTDLGRFNHGTYEPMHWYYGGLAAFQCGGGTWEAWNRRLRNVLLKSQRGDGHRTGSWDPRGPTGSDGGRVVTTALLALCLEVYYRYPRVTSLR